MFSAGRAFYDESVSHAFSERKCKKNCLKNHWKFIKNPAKFLLKNSLKIKTDFLSIFGRFWAPKWTSDKKNFIHLGVFFWYFFVKVAKRRPRASKRRSRHPKKLPKRLPRRPQDPPRGSQDAPKTAQEAPKPPQDSPRGSQDAPKTFQDTLKRPYTNLVLLFSANHQCLA